MLFKPICTFNHVEEECLASNNRVSQEFEFLMWGPGGAVCVFLTEANLKHN